MVKYREKKYHPGRHPQHRHHPEHVYLWGLVVNGGMVPPQSWPSRAPACHWQPLTCRLDSEADSGLQGPELWGMHIKVLE